MGKLRIIGGKWRGRKFQFSDVPDIRPTPDRIRETIFNWLMSDIRGATCLDLFSGSGALGLEALSRGAAKVVMVDKQKGVLDQLTTILSELQCDATELVQATVPSTALNFSDKFDIIFLDPPFRRDMLAPCIAWLEKQNCFAEKTKIYIETEKELQPLPIPDHWHIIKDKKAGQVAYYLIERIGSEHT